MISNKTLMSPSVFHALVSNRGQCHSPETPESSAARQQVAGEMSSRHGDECIAAISGLERLIVNNIRRLYFEGALVVKEHALYWTWVQ